MFEITRDPLVAEIRCESCRASMSVNSDSETMIRRALAAFQKKHICRNEPKAAAVFAVRRCRVCGCTDDDCSKCIERTGHPCHWVEKDLCSACVEEKRHEG